MMKKEMTTHSSILAWRIPLTGEAGGLWSMGSQRVGHELSTQNAMIVIYIWKKLEKNPQHIKSLVVLRIFSI